MTKLIGDNVYSGVEDLIGRLALQVMIFTPACTRYAALSLLDITLVTKNGHQINYWIQ